MEDPNSIWFGLLLLVFMFLGAAAFESVYGHALGGLFGFMGLFLGMAFAGKFIHENMVYIFPFLWGGYLLNRAAKTKGRFPGERGSGSSNGSNDFRDGGDGGGG